ncbi:MAG: MBL fold metallo-hydrolase [Bryobacteraceae bacterium]
MRLSVALLLCAAASAQVQVITCGTGSPLPDAERASSCVAIVAKGELIVIDSGPGSARKLQAMQLPLANLRGLFITHLHSDHIGDAGELMTQSWIAGRPQPLALYGPAGIEDVASGLRQMYAADKTFRIAHHGEAQLPEKAWGVTAHPLTPGSSARALAYQDEGFKVEAFLVDHAPVAPALGYRIEVEGRVIVVSGDTAKSANLIRYAAGADLLIHEVTAKDLVQAAVRTLQAMGQQRRAKMFGDVLTYHASPIDAAEAAAEAKVGMLVLTHMVPVPNAQNEARFTAGIAEIFKGPVVVAKDGQRFQLSAN